MRDFIHKIGPTLINGRWTLAQKTGVQVYSAEISLRLPDAETVIPSARWAGAKGHLWEQAILPLKISPKSILFSPGNTGPIAIRNQVVTIHDLAALDHPEWFKPSFAQWYAWMLPRLARKCRRVITVSQFSKERLLDCFDLEERRVDVIPNGISDPIKSDGTETGENEKPFFLYLGSPEPRKNLARLYEAWAAADLKNHELLIAGSAASIFAQEDVNLPKGCRALGRVSDSERETLYRNCEGFVYPSLYEGFGFPPLEAMRRGAVVIVSDIPPHREACGDAAFYFNPLMVGEIVDRLRAVSEMADDVRNRYAEVGKARAACFSWNEAAAKTQDVLRGAWNECFA